MSGLAFASMDNLLAVALALVTIALLYPIGRRWYRRRRSAKDADALLSDVLKRKDAFRR
jgi:hypothetical protein